jgi:hypothetical protein
MGSLFSNCTDVRHKQYNTEMIEAVFDAVVLNLETEALRAKKNETYDLNYTQST